ncbi:MAG: tetratricopeptide repeat protein [Planctomycetales bacterium]
MSSRFEVENHGQEAIAKSKREADQARHVRRIGEVVGGMILCGFTVLFLAPRQLPNLVTEVTQAGSFGQVMRTTSESSKQAVKHSATRIPEENVTEARREVVTERFAHTDPPVKTTPMEHSETDPAAPVSVQNDSSELARQREDPIPDPIVYISRAADFATNDDFNNARLCYQAAISVAPNDSSARLHFAWHLVTCPAAEHRDGYLAVSHAHKAIQLNDRRTYTSTFILAAAYAEAGDFKLAETWQQDAVDLATTASERSEAYRLLARYQTELPRDYPESTTLASAH